MLLNLTWRDFEVRFCKLRLLERRFSAFDVSTTFDHGYGYSAYQILRYLEIPVVDMWNAFGPFLSCTSLEWNTRHRVTPWFGGTVTR